MDWGFGLGWLGLVDLGGDGTGGWVVVMRMLQGSSEGLSLLLLLAKGGIVMNGFDSGKMVA